MTGPSPARGSRRLPSARFVVTMLFLVSVLNYVDRQVPFILLESIKADLGLSDKQMGFLNGFTFSFIYSTVAIPIAILADRWSAKWVLSGGMILWCGLTTIAGFAQNFGQLVSSRMGVAVGEAASLPSSHALISALVPPERRGTAISMVSLGVPVGAMVGLALGGWLNDVANWRIALILIGLPGVLFVLLFAWAIPDLRAPRQAPGKAYLLAGLKALASSRTMRHLIAGLSIQAIGQIAIFTFTAAFIIRSHGLTASEVGITLGLTNGVSGIAALLLSGWATDRAARRDPQAMLLLPACTFLAMAPLLVAAYLAQDIAIAVPLLALVNFCAVFYLPPAFATAQRLAPPEARAQASALLVVGVSMVGGSIGPFLVGALSDALEPNYGVEALRYSLCFTALPTLWGAVHLFLASRTLSSDLVDHQS
ncbi:MFS transporter [Sphingobium aromaticiconvertens]|uniref:spinster family MFS transporter n=1 Tax=Sphingobium aromaticiconvertens TaxID=365341 RepID=UPI00301B38B6